jgi:hypothetical protein
MPRRIVLKMLLLAAACTACAVPSDEPAAAPPPPATAEPAPADSSAEARLRTGLEMMLKGPTEAERAAGRFSFFGPETAGMLQSVELRDDGRAIVDFHDFSRIIPNASTSAGSLALLEELRGVLFAIPEVREAEIRFEGSCDAFWNWLQYDCELLHRTREQPDQPGGAAANT